MGSIKINYKFWIDKEMTQQFIQIGGPTVKVMTSQEVEDIQSVNFQNPLISDRVFQANKLLGILQQINTIVSYSVVKFACPKH